MRAERGHDDEKQGTGIRRLSLGCGSSHVPSLVGATPLCPLILMILLREE